MTLGIVLRNQVPMVITFQDEDVTFICDVLSESMDMSYKIYSMFVERVEFDPWESEE